MFEDVTTVHISIVTAIGAFFVSALSILFGYLLILNGTPHGEVGLSICGNGWHVNFFSFVPGVAFALFGSFIAWRALTTLIKKG